MSASTALSTVVVDGPDGPCLKVYGFVDPSEVESFRSRVLGATRRDGDLEADLSDVELHGRQRLSVLDLIDGLQRRNGHRLRVKHLSPFGLKLVGIAGLSDGLRGPQLMSEGRL